MKRFYSQTQLWIMALAVSILAGCTRSGPQVVPVTGTLLYQGKPVANALLNFEPEFGRQGWAITDEQGKFKINYDRHQDGAVVGKHKVWLEYRVPGKPKDAEPPSAPAQFRALFDKYSYAKSNLQVQIKPDTREIKLELD
jgi:hypothetical protein